MDVAAWIILLAAFILIEIATVNLVTIWFAAGSLAALICAICNVSPWIQGFVFVAVSALSLIFTKPLVKKISGKKTRTNFDKIVGMTGVVTEQIDNLEGKGYVIVDGKEWMARTESGETVSVGEKVLVLRIEGAKIYVRAQNPGTGPDQISKES